MITREGYSQNVRPNLKPLDPSPVARSPVRQLDILVDATVQRGEQTGIGTYISQMIAGLVRTGDARVRVLAGPETPVHLGTDEVLRAPTWARNFVARSAWKEHALLNLLVRRPPDVLFVPIPELPRRSLPVPSVIVVHDVTALTAPALYGRLKWLRFALDLPRVCSRAASVVCVSETTRLALFGAVPVDRDKLHVVGEGPGSFAAEESMSSRLITKGRVIWVGSVFQSGSRQYGHKNLEPVIAAFSHNRRNVVGEHARLIVAGPLDSHGEQAFGALVRKHGAEGRVEHRGFLSTEDLAFLFRSAQAVVYPSVVEGYGLPVLEGFCHGIPVIASDIPATREIAADAVYYVQQALSADAWATAVAHLLNDEHLQTRLAEKGFRQVRRHDWDSASRQLVEVLRRAAAGGRPGLNRSPNEKGGP